MIGKLLCYFGFHNWKNNPSGSLTIKTEEPNGKAEVIDHEIYSRRCKRCKKLDPIWITKPKSLDNCSDIGCGH